MRIGLIAIMLWGLGGLVSALPLSTPLTVTITPPAADLPPEVAALSGIWEGVWDGMQPCRLAVEELTRDAAVVVYAFGDHPAADGRGGWIRRRASVLPGGTLRWEGQMSTTKEPVTFTFTLAEDQRHLRGERRFHETWRVSLATLQPMAPALDPSHSLLLGLDTSPAPPGEDAPGGPASPDFDFAHDRPGSQLTGPALERFRIDRYRAAIPRVESEVRVREMLLGPMHPEVAMLLTHLARLYTEQGRYAEAEPLHWRALAIREEALGPTHPSVALSLHGLGEFYRHHGLPVEAEPLHRRALAIREEALGPTHPSVALSLNSLAGVSRSQRRYTEAESLQQRALAIQEEALGPIHPHVASNLNNLALLYTTQRRYAEAEPLQQRALAIGEQTLGPTHPAVATHLNNLAWLSQEQGRYAEAEPLHRRALAIREEALGPTHPAVALSLGNLATVLMRQHQRAQALPLFERARQISLAMSHANVALEDETYRGLSRQHAWSLRTYVDLLAALARESGSPSPVPAFRAFVVAEQARLGAVQMALARAGARAATGEASTATLAWQVEELRRRQRALWQQLSEADTTPGAGGDTAHRAVLQPTLRQVDRELAEATTRLHEAFPRYAELTAPVPIDIPAVQALLHPDEALISWFTLADRVLIWLVRPGQELIYRDVPVAKAELTALVSRVRRSLEQGPWEPFAVAQAHALYTLLLAPLRAHVTGVTHLLLVPDDVLRPLPFGALVTEATGRSYRRLAELATRPRRPTAADLAAYAKLAWLARDNALTMLPSATALRTLRQLPRLPGEGGEPLLGFGDPVLQGDGGPRGALPMPTARGTQVPLDMLRRLPRLPETQAELLAVATALGADPERALYLGAQATEPTIRALHRTGRLGRAQVLVFATHALLAGEVTGLRQPALVLTPPATTGDEDDGLLTLEDIVGLTLPQAAWVVLSACHTAADDGSGEALSGLARAFFHAGAAALLVSQWSVDDVATRVLMTEVFRRQAETPSLLRAEALRQAMRAVMTRAQGKTAYFAHPFAWAPFMLVGEGGRGRP